MGVDVILGACLRGSEVSAVDAGLSPGPAGLREGGLWAPPTSEFSGVPTVGPTDPAMLPTDPPPPVPIT